MLHPNRFQYLLSCAVVIFPQIPSTSIFVPGVNSFNFFLHPFDRTFIGRLLYCCIFLWIIRWSCKSADYTLASCSSHYCTAVIIATLRCISFNCRICSILVCFFPQFQYDSLFLFQNPSSKDRLPVQLSASDHVFCNNSLHPDNMLFFCPEEQIGCITHPKDIPYKCAAPRIRTPFYTVPIVICVKFYIIAVCWFFFCSNVAFCFLRIVLAFAIYSSSSSFSRISVWCSTCDLIFFTNGFKKSWNWNTDILDVLQN